MFSTSAAAKYLGISPEYLRNMRQQMHVHEAPPHVVQKDTKNRLTCFYAQADLDIWKAKHPFRTWRKKSKRNVNFVKKA